MEGKLIRDILGFQYGPLSEIESADISLYQTCRGTASDDQIKSIFDLVIDENAGEDERSWAINDGLWDLLIHQYTLYSATPIALYNLLISGKD